MKKILIILMCLVLLAGCSSPSEKEPNETPAEKAPEITDQTSVPENTVDEDAQEEEYGYKVITAQEAKKLIDEIPDIQIIDVSPYYYDGHIPGALNYYLGDGTLKEQVKSFDKEKTYLLYCCTEASAIMGAKMLVDNGIKNVYRLKGNLAAWREAGYEVNEGHEQNLIKYNDVTPEFAKLMIDNNPELIIIDVSTKYKEGHLPGAVNYPIAGGELKIKTEEMDPEKSYLVYCHTDAESMTGAQKLIDAGFTHVFRLQGNYQAWTDAGYDVE